MHSVCSDFQEPTEARPRPAGHHGLEEQELAARPDQNKTLSTAAPAAGGAPATAAAAAAAPSKHGKHEQMPAPYHTIPAEVDRNNPKKNADGRGRPDSSQQALKQRESKQVRMGRALLTCGGALDSNIGADAFTGVNGGQVACAYSMYSSTWGRFRCRFHLRRPSLLRAERGRCF